MVRFVVQTCIECSVTLMSLPKNIDWRNSKNRVVRSTVVVVVVVDIVVCTLPSL